MDLNSFLSTILHTIEPHMSWKTRIHKATIIGQTTLLGVAFAASASFPVSVTDLGPSVASPRGYVFDHTRSGRVVLGQDYFSDTVFHTLDGRNDTPTAPIRTSLSTAFSAGVQIFPTDSGSVWALNHPIFNISPPPPIKPVEFLSFDNSGVLTHSQRRNLSRETILISTESGVFGITPSTITAIASNEISTYRPCDDENGAALSPCFAFRSYTGNDLLFWTLRYVGAGASGRLELVPFRTSGEQLSRTTLLALSDRPEVKMTNEYGFARIRVTSAQETVLFNVSFAPTVAGRISGAIANAWPLANGKWLILKDGLYSHVSLSAISTTPAPVTLNYSFAFAQSGSAPVNVQSNAAGDVLVSQQVSTNSRHGRQVSTNSRHGRQVSTNSRHGRQVSTNSRHDRQVTTNNLRYEWRNAQGSLLLSGDGLLAATLEPAGNLLTLKPPVSGVSAGIVAERLSRAGSRLGELEALSDSAIRPQRVSLLRGANDTLLSVSLYTGERENVINRINVDGSKVRLGSFRALGFASLLHAQGSPWVSQFSVDLNDPVESFNTLSSARFFTPNDGTKFAVGDALYEFKDDGGTLELQIFRDGQPGSVALPAIASTLIEAKPVKPALADQDELRFIARAQNDSSMYLVFGVSNGQAFERFRFVDKVSFFGQLLSDGSVIVISRDFTSWRRLTPTNPTGAVIPLCGYPIDDGAGGLWSSKRVTVKELPIIMCFTGRDGLLREAITPIALFSQTSKFTEDGDWLQLDDYGQTRFRVVDGVVRHQRRPLPSQGRIGYDSAINIGDKIYFTLEQSNTAATGLFTSETFIDQIDLIPAAEVIDQYTRSGFE
jgi:hypothetical protein